MKITGYELLKQEEIKDVQSTGYLFRHKKSGARVCVLANEDDNKVFHITFRTPPPDSTGVAHILEHSVLCGSRHFPSKDPFVELAKGSLNTFLNAMTYPDKTMYPVASCNEKDFANLMHVYMDAVFFTNIYQKEEIFRQEGWNYRLEHPEDELTYNGVVYNEMKGAFSSPEDVLEREILNSLFPDTPYGNESGGDPEAIPDLTYSAFMGFHSKYYHPSNSYLYLYGNMDISERLGWLDRAYLSQYDEMPVTSAITPQQPFASSREVCKKYSISNADSEAANTYLSYNVAIETSLEVQLSNAFAVIEYALLSAPGAPLKQALLDAGIGKDIMGSYDSGTFQPIFSIVAKNSEAEKKAEFLQIIRKILQDTVTKGMDEKAVLAGINYMEFRFREADFGNYPKGLMYGIDMLDSWLYDDMRPFDYLHQLEIFAFLKKQTKTGYFEDLIQRYLLDNTHVSIVIVEPEKGLTAKLEDEVKAKLKLYKESLAPEEIQELVEKTRKLEEFQDTPSSKEELAAIPMLSREDIKREAEPIYNKLHLMGETHILHHEIFTNGIGYLNLAFDTKYVKEEYIPYLGILKGTLGLIDTEHYSYGDLFNEINMRTGGIYPAIDTFPNRREPGVYKAVFEIKAKALYNELDFVFEMIGEMIFGSLLEDEKRLYEIIAQLKSRLLMRLNSAGHSTAALRAMAYFSNTAAFNEAVNGIAFYKLVESIEANFPLKKAELIRILKELVTCIFRKDTLMVSYTSEEKGYLPLTAPLERLKERLPEGELIKQPQLQGIGKKNEGFQTSSKIQYVARAGNYRMAGFDYHGALKILKVILSYEYLWNNVRVKGGAYGCMSGFGANGDAYFASYRDPNLSATNQVYEGITEYVKNFTVDSGDMIKYIIGAISELDTPLSPMMKGVRSFGAYMSHSTIEDYQRERNEILGATPESIRSLARIMKAILQQNSLCVIGNEEKLAAEKDLFMELKPLIG